MIEDIFSTPEFKALPWLKRLKIRLTVAFYIFVGYM